MRNRRPSPDHAEAVARRLALLEAELDATRREGGTHVVDRVAHPVPHPAAGPQPLHPYGAAGQGSLPESAAVEWVDLAAEAEPSHPGADEPVTAPADLAGGAVRVPGRHARRRRSGRLLDTLAGGLAGRVRFTVAHVTVVVTVVAAALGVTCWWLLAGRVEPVLSPVASPVRTLEPGAVAPSITGAATATAAPSGRGGQPSGAPRAVAASGAAEIVVDVAGKVRRPGIVVLPAGSRVVDALEAAGGARRGVDLSPLNLARPLADGEQILVGVAPVPGNGGGAGRGAGGGPGGVTLVNVNLASLEELDTLPGVGPVTAGAIVDWRERHGGFTAVDDLLEVDGIGDATLQKLAPLVTL